MDTMEQAALGRDNRLLLICLMILIACACHQQMASSALSFYNIKEISIHFRNDTMLMNDAPMNGIVYQLYDNKDTLKVETYKDGVLDGWKYSFYENKQQRDKSFYIQGKANGVSYNWYETGQKRFVYHFKNNEFNGLLCEWHSNGTLLKKLHYKNGHEDGMQQYWYDDGSVRANYEARNGRVYGLIGTMGCTNIKAHDVDKINSLRNEINK